MSWSGPVAGATPYQPPPYATSQAGYGQQQTQFQYGQQPSYGQYQAGPSYPQSGPQSRPSDNRPPKKKGNPIITRYPPPPGYRGPAQPQGPYGANSFPNHYQQPHQPYPQNANAHPNYPPQGYAAPAPSQGYSPPGYGSTQQPPYSQPGYQQGQNYQWPQQNYPQNQGYSQGANYPGGQGFAHQNPFPSHSSKTISVDSNQSQQPPYRQTGSWQPPNSHPSNSQHIGGAANSTVSDPEATPIPLSAHPAPSTSQVTPSDTQPSKGLDENSVGEKPQLFLAWDDWDFDFDGAIWPKSNEPVDPNLSLGVIIWRPAKQMTRALPSTYDEAEEQALKPLPEKLGNGESVSIYFTTENSHEAFLDVRQTDDWDKIQRDPIFVVFTDETISQSLVSLEDCIAQRDRPDLPIEKSKRNEDEEMRDSTWNVMDNLEQALSGNNENTSPLRRQTQEDILAQLGVTGSPKTPSDEAMPMPASGSEEKPPASLPAKPPAPSGSSIPLHPEQPPQRSQSFGGHRNLSFTAPAPRPYGSMSSSSATHTLTPERKRSNPFSHNPSQTQPGAHPLETVPASPTRSEGSTKTMTGCDLESEHSVNLTNNTPSAISQLHRSDSSSARKRSYEDTDPDDEKMRQQDSNARRKRRPQVAPAYGRR